jgi:hypothetical protein
VAGLLTSPAKRKRKKRSLEYILDSIVMFCSASELLMRRSGCKISVNALVVISLH